MDKVVAFIQGNIIQPRKRKNIAACNNMDGPRDYHISERSQVVCVCVCVCACSVAWSCLTLCGSTNCGAWLLPGFSACGIFQAKLLECNAISYSRGSSRSTSLASPSLAGGFFTTSTNWEAPSCDII